jgi:hypothetical protein
MEGDFGIFEWMARWNSFSGGIANFVMEGNAHPAVHLCTLLSRF